MIKKLAILFHSFNNSKWSWLIMPFIFVICFLVPADWIGNTIVAIITFLGIYYFIGNHLEDYYYKNNLDNPEQ